MFPAASAASIAATLFIAFALSGCLDDAVDDALAMQEAPSIETGLFELSGSKCVQAGGVSTYAGPTRFADTYDSADVSEEVNSPFPKGNPASMGRHQWANWHMGFNCETASVGEETQQHYIFGYIGQMVEAPAWDPGGADQHFIVTGLGFGNGTFADGLRAATTADITHAYVALVEYYTPKNLPRSSAYIEYSDVEKGIYMQYTKAARSGSGGACPSTVRNPWRRMATTRARSTRRGSSGTQCTSISPRPAATNTPRRLWNGRRSSATSATTTTAPAPSEASANPRTPWSMSTRASSSASARSSTA
jgi:hypothetical protein